MKKILISLLSASVLLGCNEDEVQEETTLLEETEDNNTGGEIETEIDGEQEEELELIEANSIIFQRDMWHFNDEVAYELYGEVGPIIRDGEYAILPVLIDTEDDIEISFGRLFDIGIGTQEGINTMQGFDIRLIDSKENTVSHTAVVQGLYIDFNDSALQTFVGEGSRNEQMMIGANHDPAQYYAVFAAPESDEVHVLFTGEVGIIEQVPVIDREGTGILTFSELEEEENINPNELLHAVPTAEEILEKELMDYELKKLEDQSEAIAARVESLEIYRESVETTVSRIDEVDHSTLILSSDVLFEFDEAELTEEADAELEAAIAELEGVEGGELEIVGHTDNEHTEEYNQELSESRAESVRERLHELMDIERFDEVTTRGESFRQPIADNNTEEGRAQNRRVELHFTPPTEEVEIQVEQDLPKALGEEAEYPGTVQTRFGEIEIDSVRRIDDLLIGRIRVRPNEEGNSGYDALTQIAGIGARGWYADDSGEYNQWSVYTVTLIHEGQRYYPSDYYLTPLVGSDIEMDLEEAENTVNYIVPLSDRYIADMSSLGSDGFYTATVVWPAVNSDTVTIDLSYSEVFGEDEGLTEATAPWRILNVPVENSEEVSAEGQDDIIETEVNDEEE